MRARTTPSLEGSLKVRFSSQYRCLPSCTNMNETVTLRRYDERVDKELSLSRMDPSDSYEKVIACTHVLL